jgi:anti-sigma factor RsiW
VLPTGKADSLPLFNKAKNLSYYFWHDHGYGHIVIGNADADKLEKIAAVIRN